MQKFRSVGALIMAITSLLAVMLVFVFCVMAANAMQRQQQAAQDMHRVEEARRLLTARQAARLESGVVMAAMVTPAPASAQVRRQLLHMHATTQAAMDAVRADMARDGRSKALYAAFDEKNSDSQAQWRKAMAALRLPRARRPERLYDSYTLITRQRLETLDSRSAILSRDVARSDRFNAQMMKINDLVWRLRIDTGYDRGNITRVLQQASAVSPQQRDEFLRSDGRIDSVWESLRTEGNALEVPQALIWALNNADRAYFKTFRPQRRGVVNDLLANRVLSLTGQQWLDLSNPALSSITAISETVFVLTQAHARAELHAADRSLALALLLMLVSIGLAWSATVYVRKHIVAPLRTITRRIPEIAAGDPHMPIPFETRQDEIGEFARGLRLLRESNHDRRQLEAARQAADMANRVKSEFLANMSHELRTPLNAILGFSDIMRGEMFGPLAPRYAEYSGLIHQSGQHLLNLVSDILDLSKVEAGKWDLSPANLDMAQTLDYCLRMVAQRAEHQAVRLVTDIADAPPNLFADERACRQILLNLMTNAVKFSRPGGIVTVRAWQARGEIRIAVQDQGIGIPASELPRIGTAFEQATNNAYVANGEGTGLGLALVKSLLALHKGSFAIESTEGVGTTVTVGFPLRMAAGRAA